MGATAAGYGCADFRAAGSFAVRPDDRDEPDREGRGSEGAVVDTGAGLHDRSDFVTQPVGLPRRQSLHRL